VGLLVGLSSKRLLVRQVSLDTPPQVLTAKAREVIRVAGYEDAPADSLSTFLENASYIRHLRDLEPTPGRWDVLGNGQPSAVRFGYRESPLLLARNDGSIGDWLQDPPPTYPGMVQVALDTEGRLLSFSAVPPRKEDADEPAAGEPDWAPLFAAAGFDPQAFTPVDPVWLPTGYADRRVAWTGVYPEAPDVSIRVEAASYRERPVAFHVIEPWVRGIGKAAHEQGFWDRVADVVSVSWFAVVLVGAGFVALRNIRLGRGDRKTALRFALYLGAMRMLWLLGAHHVPSSAELDVFTAHLAWSLYRFGLAYVFYLALEPYARKLWPHMLVSWVRLMGGRFRDPLVGRDLLVGALYGTGAALITSVMVWIPEVLGIRGYGFDTDVWPWESLRGLRHSVAAIAGVHTQSLLFTFMGIMMFLVLRLLLRKTWIAVVVFTVLAMLLFNPGTGHPVLYVIGVLTGMLLFWFVLFRFGLLPIVLGRTVCDLLLLLPLTFDLTIWYGYVTLLTLFVTVGVAAWGFWIALAGRPLFRDEILEAGASTT
jgi:serine/threonine-protein kinase